jgi:hypothetical protein
VRGSEGCRAPRDGDSLRRLTKPREGSTGAPSRWA